MNHTDCETLVDQFRRYLEEGRPEGEEKMERETDLFSLFTELEGLRNEVRIHSRQMKGALDDFRGVFSTLEGSHASLGKELERVREENRTLRRESLRPMLLELLDLYDRMAAGLGVKRPARSFWGRFCRQDEDLVAALREGQTMNVQRLLQLLAAQEVRPLEVVGQRFDPHCMRAVAVEEADGAEGLVAAELRRGFLWGDELLRAAEVRVYKIKASNAEDGNG